MTGKAASGGDSRWLLQLAALPIVYYAGAKLSLAFTVAPDALVMMWVPNGIMLAALLHYRWRRFIAFAPLIIAAEIAADHATFAPGEAALFGAINLLEVSAAYALLRRWRFDPRFSAPHDTVKFLVSGPLAAALLSAIAAACVYRYFQGAKPPFLETLRVWWFSDGLGLLILTPLAIGLWPAGARIVDERVRLHWYDAAAFLMTLGIMIPFALSQQRVFDGITVRSFFLIPPLLYVAVRFSVRVTAMVVAAVAVLILYVVKNGQQPFGDVPMFETVLSAQELIFIMGAMALGIATLLSQHREGVRQLESRVAERTAELSRANSELLRLATSDPLTGLLNRRALYDLLRRETDRERRYDHPLAVVMLDIDHFKEVNDRHGHAVGDIVLRHVASVCTQALRASDALARYGGEEFVILAPETDRSSALQLAERVRDALRSTDVPVDHTRLQVTASFGVAMLRPDDRDPDQILARADRALYAAKAAGRDQVVMADND